MAQIQRSASCKKVSKLANETCVRRDVLLKWLSILNVPLVKVLVRRGSRDIEKFRFLSKWTEIFLKNSEYRNSDRKLNIFSFCIL